MCAHACMHVHESARKIMGVAGCEVTLVWGAGRHICDVHPSDH